MNAPFLDSTSAARAVAGASDGPAAPPVAGQPVTPVPTPPLSTDKFTGWDGGPDPTTWLAEFDAAGVWELPRNVKWFTLGGSRKLDGLRVDTGSMPVVHICIPGRGLSATHLLLERRADKLRIYDQHSTNGTFMRGRKIDMADLNPGDTFSPNPITLIAMNDEMHRHRPVLYEIIGVGSRPPDAVMIEAATGSGPILITGERGCDHARLARAIHAMSLRRQQAMIEISKLPEERRAQIALAKQASQARTTVVLSLAPDGPPLDPLFSSMLWSTGLGVRVIVLARTDKIARDALGQELVGQMHHVALRQLAYRTVEIDQLLDGMLSEKQAAFRTADLTRENQAALRAHNWPKNLAELRQLADDLIAHATHGNLRDASKQAGRSHAALGRDFARAGLTFPLFRHG